MLLCKLWPLASFKVVPWKINASSPSALKLVEKLGQALQTESQSEVRQTSSKQGLHSTVNWKQFHINAYNNAPPLSEKRQNN